MDVDKLEIDRSSSTIVFGQRSYGVRHLLILALAAGLGLAIGLLVGKFAIGNDREMGAAVYIAGEEKGFQERMKDASVSKLIMDSIDHKRIEENLRVLTKKPHISGRNNDFELVSLIQKHFRDHGLMVQTTPYDALLSYPSDHTPNSVRVLNETGDVIYDGDQDGVDVSRLEGVVPAYNAYAPKGLVEGEVVYAGYGRHIEFDTLLRLGVNITGRIALIKYGKIFRGSQVAIAHSYGAVGVILFSDPLDHTGVKNGDTRVFPDTWWLPPTGAQRGTLAIPIGDPLTPGYPSNNQRERGRFDLMKRHKSDKHLAFRKLENQTDLSLPQIPCQPISYGAAYNIFRYMSGPQAPSNWTGGLNITYRLGPGFIQPGLRVQLNVTNVNQRAKVENVFGIIEGTVEPDRYVLIGNHRDAWMYGSSDPSSGTAVLMEVARVMGDLVKTGRWKPRRSIMFCNWGAEEFGLIGSTEWVEQYVATLRERVVGYINVDSAVRGNHTLQVFSTPLFHNIVYDASKKVPNPNPVEVQAGRSTVYDTWLHVTSYSGGFYGSDAVPLISALGSGSDYATLLQLAGVTSVDLSYTYSRKIYDISHQPLYHTEFETFEAVKNHYDRDFQAHTAVGRVVSEMTRSLADSVVLPFNVSNYAKGIEKLRQNLHIDFGVKLRAMVQNYDMLKDVIDNFTKDVADFEEKLLTVDKSNPYLVRSINDRIMLLERAFLIPEGLPLRPLKKHILFAENANDIYSATSFPGLNELMFQIDLHPERWEAVRRHFSSVLHTIQSAGATLRDVTGFMSETL